MILSIDVGIRNLAMCLIDENTKLIKNWDVSGIPPQHSDGLFQCMIQHLDDRPWVLDSTTILIEKQPDKNRKMKSVENLLHAYFVIKLPRSETIIYDARHKIPDVCGAGKAKYRERKLASINRCRDFLEAEDVNAHWRDHFKESKKKDDLADTVMQALSYTKRIPAKSETAEAKKKAATIKSRKPTEHQKDTKYSKSNLAWFMKNNTEEVLLKNKRFMKDVKRYFHDINDLKKCLD